MHGHDIIVIGASAGGIETLKEIVRELPAALPAAVFIVVHLAPGSISVLPDILGRAGPLRAVHPRDGQAIEPGVIYIAPPDYHLLVQPGQIRLGQGPRENRCRPAVDTLFRSAAAAYGPRVVGVVLSGGLDDGSAGLIAIKARGGVAVVQDPETALFPGMPESAIRNAAPEHIVPASAVAGLLARLAREPAAEPGPRPSELLHYESHIAALQKEGPAEDKPSGIPAGFSCPDCGGTLFELKEGDLTRYRCRVGHAYSPDTLLAEQSDSIETALWSALRALEESAALSRQVAERARRSGRVEITERFQRRAEQTERQAERIKQVLARPHSEIEVDGAGTGGPAPG